MGGGVEIFKSLRSSAPGYKTDGVGLTKHGQSKPEDCPTLLRADVFCSHSVNPFLSFHRAAAQNNRLLGKEGFCQYLMITLWFKAQKLTLLLVVFPLNSN